MVLVDLTRRAPTLPGIFGRDDGVGLIAKRRARIPMSAPPAVRIIPDKSPYSAYERSADEIDIVDRIRWFAREVRS
jgi:hypothetical protein